MKKLNVTAVGDTAHDLAEDIKTDLAILGTDALRVATDYLAPRARDLADYITPRVRDAADNVVEYVQPRATDLGRRGVQFASDTRDAVQPRLVAFAADTRDAVQPLIGEARHVLQPRLDDAVQHVQPLVDAGRERFNADVMPHLVDVIEGVNALPQTQDAKDRLLAARAALAGELKLPSPAELVVAEPKRSIGKSLLQVVVAGGLLAGIAYAVKRFLAPEDSGWQAHEPSEAYLREDESPVVVDATGAADASDATEPAEPAEAPAEPAAADPVTPYGAGSYVGTDPGPEFVIKGNERSMKFHVQGSGGFDRTIADVWFDSEETAQAAGFTKAQR